MQLSLEIPARGYTLSKVISVRFSNRAYISFPEKGFFQHLAHSARFIKKELLQPGFARNFNTISGLPQTRNLLPQCTSPHGCTIRIGGELKTLSALPITIARWKFYATDERYECYLPTYSDNKMVFKKVSKRNGIKWHCW